MRSAIAFLASAKLLDWPKNREPASSESLVNWCESSTWANSLPSFSESDSLASDWMVGDMCLDSEAEVESTLS